MTRVTRNYDLSESLSEFFGIEEKDKYLYLITAKAALIKLHNQLLNL